VRLLLSSPSISSLRRRLCQRRRYGFSNWRFAFPPCLFPPRRKRRAQRFSRSLVQSYQPAWSHAQRSLRALFCSLPALCSLTLPLQIDGWLVPFCKAYRNGSLKMEKPPKIFEHMRVVPLRDCCDSSFPAVRTPIPALPCLRIFPSSFSISLVGTLLLTVVCLTPQPAIFTPSRTAFS
jgi:hypothetical protein